MLTQNRDENIKLLRSVTSEVYSGSPILADLALTQGVHESNLLRKPSQLAEKYNNLFGIKGKGLTGKSVMLPTWEVVKGKTVYVKAAFAFNDSLEDSVKQHSNLMQKPRYKSVLEAKTLDEAFEAVYTAGYATDPKYAQKLQDVWKQVQIILTDI